MNQDLPSQTSLWGRANDRQRAAIEIALIFAVFYVHAGLNVPGSNEPYYLAKAKHYWNPGWCSGDLFLNSADAHNVFYWTIGWLTLLLPLPAVAIVGRLLTYGLMAWGWQRLSFAIVPRPLLSVLSAVLFVALRTHFHMAGEWVVGGLEAKGFAYALVFFGLAELVRNRWNRALILFGAASSFHVLVGGWTVVAAGIAWLLLCKDSDRPRLSQLLPGLGVGLLIALPGLIAVWTLTAVQDPALADQALRIQVFDRLPHHLYAGQFMLTRKMTFPYLNFFAIRQLFLVATWGILWYRTPGNKTIQRLHQVVLGSLAITLAGILITVVTANNATLSASLLRFYWFRLSEVLLPVGVALAVVDRIGRVFAERPRARVAWLALALILGAMHLGDVSWARFSNPVPAGERAFVGHSKRLHDWRAICTYIKNTTPNDAVFITPNRSATFKWHADRSVVAIWKEMPQDSGTIILWWDRVQDIHNHYPEQRSLTDLSSRDLRELGNRYGASYLVVRAEPQLSLDCLYRNNSFALYRLAPTHALIAKPSH